jgi:DNA-binding MarR family transcriptional regulator
MADADSAAAADIATIEQAVTRIVRWATRNDVQQELMRRARCDLPRGHVWLLGRLERCGPVRLSELAAAMGIDNSTLTPQAQRLERDGYAVRQPDPHDRRAALLRITRSGRGLLTRLHTTRRAMLAELLGDWPPPARAQAAEQLAHLAALLDAATEGADQTKAAAQQWRRNNDGADRARVTAQG